VVAVVGVQHHVALASQVILLAGQPAPVRVDRGIDVAVVEDEYGERAFAIRDVHDP
jgi:hypothetical protein